MGKLYQSPDFQHVLPHQHYESCHYESCYHDSCHCDSCHNYVSMAPYWFWDSLGGYRGYIQQCTRHRAQQHISIRKGTEWQNVHLTILQSFIFKKSIGPKCMYISYVYIFDILLCIIYMINIFISLQGLWKAGLPMPR